MDVTLSADLTKQVEQELASGHYRSRDELIEQAVRHFFDERQRGKQRLDALRGIGQAFDQAGLYERVLITPVRNDGHTSRGPGRLAEPPRLFEPKWSEEIIREANLTLEMRCAPTLRRHAFAHIKLQLPAAAVARHAPQLQHTGFGNDGLEGYRHHVGGVLLGR